MRSWILLLSLGTLMPALETVRAECHGAANCGCHVQCPNCRCYCKLTVEKEKEKNHCWEVECEQICVPKVRFPWESCCKPKCAYVKHVHVLKKVEHECEHCKYVWEPVCVPCARCASGNCAGSCATSGCERGPVTPMVPPAKLLSAPPSDIEPPPSPPAPPLSLRERLQSYFQERGESAMHPVSVSTGQRDTATR